MADTNPFLYSTPPLEYANATDILVLGRGAGAVNVYARGFLRRDATGAYTTGGAAIVAGADNRGLTLACGEAFSAGGGAIVMRGKATAFNAGGLEIYSGTGESATERIRILANGYVGIGRTAPAFPLEVNGIIGSTGFALRGASTTAWQRDIQWQNSAGALKWAIGADVLNNGGRSFYLWDAVGAEVRLLVNEVDARWHANLLPNADNNFNLGWSSYRWKDTYLVNAPTVTSDERDKLWIGVREDSRAVWLRIARRIFEELGFYQWRDAVEAKGDNGARWHFGARAQRVWAIVADEGLAPPLIDGLPDPAWAGPPAPAFLCFDRWDAEHEEEPVYSETLVGEDGKPLQIATRTVVARAAGNRFGFRVDQLGLLLDWSLHMEREADRVEIAELHARVAVLEAA